MTGGLPRLVDNTVAPGRRGEGGVTGDNARPDSRIRVTPTRSHTKATGRDARLEGELRSSVSVLSDRNGTRHDVRS